MANIEIIGRCHPRHKILQNHKYLSHMLLSTTSIILDNLTGKSIIWARVGKADGYRAW